MRIRRWKDGERNRPGGFHAPCSCGCDLRDGYMVGYYSRSDAEGNGITIVYETMDELVAAIKSARDGDIEIPAEA